MPVIEIKLSNSELYHAASVGILRRITSIKLPTNGKNMPPLKNKNEKWFNDILGALGELAFAKAYNLYWPGSINAKKDEPDIPPNYQIRTSSKNDNRLIIRHDDTEDFKYGFVTWEGEDSLFVVHGWILGKDAKKNEWLYDANNEGKPSFFIPSKFLML